MNILFAPYGARLPGGQASPKNYLFAVRLNELLEQAGHQVLQVGSNQEMQIAKQIERGRSFKEVTEMLQECDTFIAVDSYLQHHAWFVKKRGIVIWGPSDYKIFGHPEHINLSRDGGYVRPRQFECWTQIHPNPEAFVKPEVVMFQVHRLEKELGL